MFLPVRGISGAASEVHDCESRGSLRTGVRQGVWGSLSLSRVLNNHSLSYYPRPSKVSLCASNLPSRAESQWGKSCGAWQDGRRAPSSYKQRTSMTQYQRNHCHVSFLFEKGLYCPRNHVKTRPGRSSIQAACCIKGLLSEWFGSQTEWNISPIFFTAEKTWKVTGAYLLLNFYSKVCLI